MQRRDSPRAARDARLDYQYGDAEKLRIRYETHARYSEREGAWADWMLPHIAPAPGLRLLDAGCGPGSYHRRLVAIGVRIAAMDRSPGMVREVQAQGSALGRAVSGLVGDVSALPFAAASFDRAMANHMMYYVEDQHSALEGLRRLLRPDGRLIMATNAADNLARFYELHALAASSLGYTPGPRDAASFTLDDLPLVRSVFPTAEVVVREDAFVFDGVEPALRYYASGLVDSIESPPADGGHRAALAAAMRELILEIIQREGVFRVPKNSGCFVAQL